MAGLTKRQIDASKSESGKEIRLWDDDPRGLGIRIKPSGVKTFFVQFRSPVTFKKTRLTIGQYGRLTLDQARSEARKILGGVAKGEDPAEERKRQVVDKYLVQDRSTAEVFETPQYMYILIAATLFQNYPTETRLDYVRRYYNSISKHKMQIDARVS